MLRIALLSLLLLAACSAGRREPAVDSAPALPVTRENLLGRWDHPAAFDGRNTPLWVDDSTFTFDSVGDTLFRYWYALDGKALTFDDGQGGVTRARVVRLTADSLVLADLPFFAGPLRFSRATAP